MAAATAPLASLKLNLIVHHHRQKSREIGVTLRRNRSRLEFDPIVMVLSRRRLPARHPLLMTRAGSDGGDAAEANPLTPPLVSSSPNPTLKTGLATGNVSSGQNYVGLFVRMLGLDNDPLDRELAVVTLWKYSQGGKNCIDGIMQFPGCINLAISLLKSDSCSSCEAAAGLLRTVSSVNLYREVISESGAIEELIGLLCQSSLRSEVKEQSLCTLWNLSVDEKHRVKLANNDFLPLLVKFLDDEDVKVKEAAGGILANLSLSPCNHHILVEAAVIPKLASLLKSNAEGFKVIQKEAKTALLELSTNGYYRILIIEEGLIRVPVVGAAAYKSFRSPSHSWPSLPDGTKFRRSSRPSRYGASELLLGLNIHDKNFNLEEAKMRAIVGRSQQQFLARIGAIEKEDGDKSSQSQQHTLLPLIDGVARLVLILGLEDISAITKAAYSIADASINEYMRISFKEAGALKPLVRLLYHNSSAIQESVAHALERLCHSYEVCQTVEAEGVLEPLTNILKHTDTSKSLLEKIVNILSLIFNPGKDMKRKCNDKAMTESERVQFATSSRQDAAEVTERETIVDSGTVSCLVNMLRTSSPNLQVKVASILEYIATFQRHETTITQSDIESGLVAVFQQATLDGMEGAVDEQLELDPIKLEEIGLATAAASRLLTKLLNLEQFYSSIDAVRFICVLQKTLRCGIPLHAKNWVAACLVKLESLGGSSAGIGQPIGMEVALYGTIPRLVEQMASSFAYESQAAAAVELNEVVSRGGVECTRAVAAAGGIFPLVRLIDEGSEEALEASLAILYNLSMDSENHSAIIAAGAVPVLKRIVISEGSQWRRALHLLRSLPT